MLSQRLEQAEVIAKDSLRKCYMANQGIIAATSLFDDFWGRDSFFASLGALAIGDYDIVRDNLNLYIKFQRKDGLIPRRIDRHVVTLKYLGIPIKRRLKPTYVSPCTFWKTYPSIDTQCLFLIIFAEYCLKAGNKDFLRDNADSFLRALSWLHTNESGNTALIKEGPYSSWTDSVAKKGHVLYTNCLYYWALRKAAELFSENKHIYRHPALAHIRALTLKENIQEYFREKAHY